MTLSETLKRHAASEEQKSELILEIARIVEMYLPLPQETLQELRDLRAAVEEFNKPSPV